MCAVVVVIVVVGGGGGGGGGGGASELSELMPESTSLFSRGLPELLNRLHESASLFFCGKVG